jgi:hypothetical protein
MKNALLILSLVFSTTLFAQVDDITVRVYQDSVCHSVNEFKILERESFEKNERYKGISKQWTHMISFNFGTKNFQVPIDIYVRSITLIDNELADGYCNRVTYWTASDAVRIYEHGNGCTDMNDFVINDKKNVEPSLIMEGIRVVPYDYDEK